MKVKSFWLDQADKLEEVDHLKEVYHLEEVYRKLTDRDPSPEETEAVLNVAKKIKEALDKKLAGYVFQ